MKKTLLIAIMLIAMTFSTVALTSCNSGGGDAEEGATTEQEATEETVRAADPMTEEEMQNDDSEGCIEDSEDLLY